VQKVVTTLPPGGITKDPLDGPAITVTDQPLTPAETPLAPGPTLVPIQASPNIFSPMQVGPPVQNIASRSDHVVKKQHIVDGDVPIQTNKFYANFFLGSQGNPVWTHPYSLTWANGHGNSYGMAVSHTERSQFVYGPDPQKPQYFVSPIGLQHMVLSAAELGMGTVMSAEALTGFSVYANFAPAADSRVLMTVPCVQGMGFVTAIYNNSQPMITSGVLFNTLQYIEKVNGVTSKYAIQLEDGSKWLLYATPINAVGTPPFVLSRSTINGPSGYVGMIQITKNPSGKDGERVFDRSAGAYAMGANISGSVDGSYGSYSLSWTKGGVRGQTLLMYALPHHVESFDPETRSKMEDISLTTTTKGMARAVLADKITMVEPDLPDTLGFAPWAKSSGDAQGGTSNTDLDDGVRQLITEAGTKELGQSFIPQTSLNSMYYSGKGLAKFASVVYTMQTMAEDSRLAAAGLDKLKDAFNVFVNNTQPEPLVYDNVWKGIVSGSSYRPPQDTSLDFGNTLYNDHHFHYGYFVWTAAVIGHLDPSWLEEGNNRAWVNTLVRDYASPVSDAYFPFSRAFDWYHGHSWAKGLFESSDGKDQESSSEDTFATYALKMWGKISGDDNMHARGNLQLAVQARSVHNYFLLESDNQNQPASFLGNKATGILFENKVDHTTYFGGEPAYVEGIHMIPLNPSSAYVRRKKFVQEEWDTYFSNGRADKVSGGWKGILHANLALVDPQSSYNFFADPNFDYGMLDGGASRTWYLAYAASLLSMDKGNTVSEPVEG
jgi:endo-1,3(4)-beta-glucanase